MLTSRTMAEAAVRAGVGERTLKRWKSIPAFQRAYKAAQSEILEDAVCQSRQQLTGALTALSDVTADADAPPAARVSAARACIEMALKLGEQADLLERVTALEKALNGGESDAQH